MHLIYFFTYFNKIKMHIYIYKITDIIFVQNVFYLLSFGLVFLAFKQLPCVVKSVFSFVHLLVSKRRVKLK